MKNCKSTQHWHIYVTLHCIAQWSIETSVRKERFDNYNTDMGLCSSSNSNETNNAPWAMDVTNDSKNKEKKTANNSKKRGGATGASRYAVTAFEDEEIEPNNNTTNEADGGGGGGGGGFYTNISDYEDKSSNGLGTKKKKNRRRRNQEEEPKAVADDLKGIMASMQKKKKGTSIMMHNVDTMAMPGQSLGKFGEDESSPEQNQGGEGFIGGAL